jgi:hypothetical protein
VRPVPQSRHGQRHRRSIRPPTGPAATCWPGTPPSPPATPPMVGLRTRIPAQHAVQRMAGVGPCPRAGSLRAYEGAQDPA